MRAASAALVAVLVLGFARPALADDPVDVLFKEGNEAAEAGQLPIAYEKLKAAWSLKQTYDIAANLGFVEKAIGKKRDGAEHIDFALKNFPPTGDAPTRAALQTALDNLRKEIGELSITSAAGATIEVNGKVVGTAPLASPIFVDPGQQVIVAKKSDIGEGKIVISVRVGEAQEVSVELMLTDRPGGDEPRPMWPGFVGLGAAAAGLGVGVAGLVLMAGAQSDADEAAGELSPGACSEPGACADLEDSLNDVVVFRNMGIAGMAAGGAVLIFAVVYLAVPNAEPKDARKAASFAPWIGPGTGGVIVSGAF